MSHPQILDLADAARTPSPRPTRKQMIIAECHLLFSARRIEAEEGDDGQELAEAYRAVAAMLSEDRA